MNDSQFSKPNRRSIPAGGAALLAAPAMMTRPASAITPAELKSKGKVVSESRRQSAVGLRQFLRQAARPGCGHRRIIRQVSRVPVESTAGSRQPDSGADRGRVDVLFATMAMFPDRAKAVQFSKPYVANIIVLVAPKSMEVKNQRRHGQTHHRRSPRQRPGHTGDQKCPAGTNILRLDGDAAAIQAVISGQAQAAGGNMFYIDRFNEAKPGVFENKLEFTRIYNGACTRLGEKEINASVNAFIDQIKSNGELAKIHEKWMKLPLPSSFPRRWKACRL